MTDYSKMIDFEINKLVALSIGGFESEDIFELQGVIFKRHGRYQYSFFDPCNNPSDAWPILKEYCIDINWDGDSDSEPLRDAMIVYLMMKESENG